MGAGYSEPAASAPQGEGTPSSALPRALAFVRSAVWGQLCGSFRLAVQPSLLDSSAQPGGKEEFGLVQV